MGEEIFFIISEISVKSKKRLNTSLLDIILEDDNDDISAKNAEESEGTDSILYHY